MKWIIICLLMLFSLMGFSQGPYADSVWLVPNSTLCSYKCMARIGKTYSIPISSTISTCLPNPYNHQDSVVKHNKMVDALYSGRLGKGWQEKILEEIEDCAYDCCPQDSIDVYNYFGKYFWAKLPNSEINEAFSCILDNRIVWLMQSSAQFKVEFSIRCIPGKEAEAYKFSCELEAYLRRKGIYPIQYSIINFGSSDPINRFDEQHEINNQLSISFLSY